MIWTEVFYKNVSTYIAMINKELSKEFPLEPLSNHIKVLGGFAFKSSEYRNIGIPIIRISDFNDEKVDLSNAKCYKEEKVFDKYQLFQGDIIIAMTGGTIGKLAIVQEGLGKLYLNQRVGKFVILKKNEFVQEYVYWLAKGVQDQVKKIGYGGAQPNVSNRQIESLEFPFPPKTTQERIISFLNDLRENRINDTPYFSENIESEILRLQLAGLKVKQLEFELTQQQTYLQLLRQTILQEAVQGKLTRREPTDEPASILLGRIKAEKAQLVKAGKLKKEKELPPITEAEMPFALPEGWVWCRLGEIGITQTGTTPPTNRKELFGSFIPFIGPGDIENSRINYDGNGLSDKGVAFGRLIPAHSILMVCIGGSIGKAAMNLKDVACNQQINAITCSSFVNPKYAYIALSSPYFQNAVLKKATGSATPIINKGKWENLLFPLPPTSTQELIINKVNKLNTYASLIEEQSTKTIAMTNLLLQTILKEAFQSQKEVYGLNETLSIAAEA